MTETDTVVIGASASGLATAACLKKAGVAHLLLEREQHVGHAWRQYASREQVVAYLVAYVAHHGLAPRFGSEVAREGERWRVQTSADQLSCRRVVIATGLTHTPRAPTWPDQESFEGTVLHSSKYVNGVAWAGKRALVVGLGNSGGEIAIDLVEHGAQTALSVRSAVNIIPRDIGGVSIMTIGRPLSVLPPWLADALGAPLLRLVLGNVEKLGLRKQTYGPNTQVSKDGRVPLIDIGTVALIREGKLELRGEIVRFVRDGVVFADGSEQRFDCVVLATGYTPSLETFLEGAPELLNEKGMPRESGCEVLPGLYLCGFHVSPRGMVREINLEAERIAASFNRAPSQLRT